MQTLLGKSESVKRIVVLHLDLICLLLQLSVYAYVWFHTYYPFLSEPTYTVEGYPLGVGLKLQYRGHLLVLIVYLILLTFFTRTYGGLKIVYLKALEVFFSQIFALLLVNSITYFQLSLMHNWLVPLPPMLLVTALQLLLTFLWVAAANRIYVKVFPPRRLLLISDAYPADDILNKFNSRKDRYVIEKCMNIAEGMEAVEEECTKGYGGVVLWDIQTPLRNKLLKFCYSHAIRIYLSPRIPDVLLHGADQMHLFDTPLFFVRDYAMKTEQAVIKRLIDLVCSVVLIVLTSPLMLLAALIIKGYDGGPVLYRQTRCTLNGKQFRILKFRSMRVDAEKDGVARLARKNDDRITPFGHVIRACRIDELPQLFNILKGEMSFIGPRPERPEIIAQYVESMPEFVFRMKVKAGLAGYAQVYGKYNTTPYDKLKLDLTYIENYSVWLDLKLMLLTLKILFTPDATEGVDGSQTTALKEEEKEKKKEKESGR